MKTILAFSVLLGAIQSSSGAILLGPTVNPANGHTYFIITGTTDWNGARSEALTMGGDLATISSPEESTYVGDLLTTLNLSWAWIGLNRASSASFE